MATEYNLKTLRDKMTNDQKICINSIWDYFSLKNEWIQGRILFPRLGKKAHFETVLKSLGGSIVYISQNRFQLTLLGVLLTDDLQGFEKLLAKYLEFIKMLYKENPETSNVLIDRIEKALGFNASEIELLSKVVSLDYHFLGSNYRESFSFPGGVENLIDIEDFDGYVLNYIFKDYYPECPIDEPDRMQYIFPRTITTQVPPTFWFINDEALKQQMESDWMEVQSIYAKNASKSCIILCGGILEGCLLNILNLNKIKSFEVLKKLKGNKKRINKDLYRWSLDDLVDVSSEMGVITKGDFHLNHAVREYRNLVHPGKQIREKINVSFYQAEVAMSSVKICIQQLSDYCSSLLD